MICSTNWPRLPRFRHAIGPRAGACIGQLGVHVGRRGDAAVPAPTRCLVQVGPGFDEQRCVGMRASRGNPAAAALARAEHRLEDGAHVARVQRPDRDSWQTRNRVVAERRLYWHVAPRRHGRHPPRAPWPKIATDAGIKRSAQSMWSSTRAGVTRGPLGGSCVYGARPTYSCGRARQPTSAAEPEQMKRSVRTAATRQAVSP